MDLKRRKIKLQQFFFFYNQKVSGMIIMDILAMMACVLLTRKVQETQLK